MIEVQTTKTLDVKKIIDELDIKSKKKGTEDKTYMITVNRALLADARDALTYYYNKENATVDDGK